MFPHARQAIQITRRTRRLDSTTWTTEVVYAITSLTIEQATAAELATWIRAGIAVGCLGLLVVRDAFLRLHYLGPASSLGAPLIIAALVVHEGLSTLAIKLVLIGVLLIGSGAVTVAASAGPPRNARA